jgi:ABC-type transport system substrate-binding protein
VGKWIGGPGPDDLIQTFHSSSATGEGSNYNNFSDARADALMDSIRYEIDEGKRNKLYLKLQEIMHEEAAADFLYAPTEKMAISKKFDNAYPSVIRPGCWVEGFKIKAGSPQQ